MANVSAHSRKQFPSCDSCGLSRVSCDASKKSNLVGTSAWKDSCSRCAKKGRRCTFDVRISKAIERLLFLVCLEVRTNNSEYRSG